jgi:hypothetical protein
VLTPQVAELIAADRIAERQRHASAARLAALARRCRPSTWGRAARRLAQGLDRLRCAVGRDQHVAAACCA